MLQAEIGIHMVIKASTDLTLVSSSDCLGRVTMAQAYVEQKCYFEYMELPIDEDHYVRVSKKEGQAVIGVFKRTKHGRLGLQLTLEQFQQLVDLRESIQLALRLIGFK